MIDILASFWGRVAKAFIKKVTGLKYVGSIGQNAPLAWPAKHRKRLKCAAVENHFASYFALKLYKIERRHTMSLQITAVFSDVSLAKLSKSNDIPHIRLRRDAIFFEACWCK